MNNRLLKEFEEFEGLSNQVFDENMIVEEKDDDDNGLRPVDASTLSSTELADELAARKLPVSGFAEINRDTLQPYLDEEFKQQQIELKAKRREKNRKAAQQLGLQRRRMLMEKTLQEEQDELARNHQFSMMIELIKENMVDTSLRIDVNSVGARTLSKAMWVNNTITALDLSANELNDHAGIYLARILRRNSTLKKIELDNNQLGPKSASAFGESLTTNTSLVHLSLDSNPICEPNDASGIKALSEAIRTNKTITSLNLWRTFINSTGGEALAAAIESNSTLLFCDIGHTEIEMTDVRRIIDKLDANLRDFEKNEREQRIANMSEAEKQRKIQEKLDEEKRQEELAKWLKDRRDQRAEDKRLGEELRMQKLQEEADERKRLLDMKKEEERKAAQEAADKKAKKKGKDKKK